MIDKRTEYVDRISALMVEWDAQIYMLKFKIESATYEKYLEYAKVIEALQIKQNDAAIKLQLVSAASDAEWESVKTGTEKVWNGFRTVLHDAVMKIK